MQPKPRVAVGHASITRDQHDDDDDDYDKHDEDDDFDDGSKDNFAKAIQSEGFRVAF